MTCDAARLELRGTAGHSQGGGFADGGGAGGELHGGGSYHRHPPRPECPRGTNKLPPVSCSRSGSSGGLMTIRRSRLRSAGSASRCLLALPWRSSARAEAQLRPPQKATFVLDADRTAYDPGTAARVAALVTIEHGWHVNSHKPSFEYLIPTVLDLDAAHGLAAGDGAVPGGEAEDLLLRAQAARGLRRRRGDAGRVPAPEGGGGGEPTRSTPRCATRPATTRSACRR